MTQVLTQIAGTAEPNNWKEARKRRHIITSATQHETFELCPRKWWFTWIRRLPGQKFQPQIFGTVLHSVAERYLRANDLGIDPQTGRPVDLYPPGWHIAQARNPNDPPDGEITPAEQDILKRLVTEAISSGVLERTPGRQIEYQFRRSIFKLGCEKCKGTGFIVRSEDVNADTQSLCPVCEGDGKGTHVEITGFIDVIAHAHVEDHKTVKEMKWAKSKDKLSKNLQVIIYAYVALMEAVERGEPMPASVTVRHNVYCKDIEDLRVRKVEVTLDAQYVINEWQRRVEYNSLYMEKIRRLVDVWSQIPEPKTGAQACNAYGGCGFQRICSGMESTEGFENRVDTFLKQQYSVPTVNGSPLSPPDGAKKMTSFAAKIGQMAGAVPGVGPMPQINPTMAPPAPPVAAPLAPPAPPPQAAPATPATPQGQQVNTTPGPPPWAWAGCTACVNNVTPGVPCGFNSKGSPCQICDINNQKVGGHVSSNFNITSAGPGYIQWTTKDNMYVGYSPVPAAAPGAAVTSDARVGMAPVAPPAPPAPSLPPPSPVAMSVPNPVTAPTVAPPPPPPPSPFNPQPQMPPVAGPAPKENDDDENGKAKGGRPAKGFIVCINCGPIRGIQSKGDRSTVHLDQLLFEAQSAIAKASNSVSFQQLDPFQRKDALTQAGVLVAEKIGNRILVCEGVSTGISDKRAFLDGILTADCTVIAALGY